MKQLTCTFTDSVHFLKIDEEMRHKFILLLTLQKLLRNKGAQSRFNSIKKNTIYIQLMQQLLINHVVFIGNANMFTECLFEKYIVSNLINSNWTKLISLIGFLKWRRLLAICSSSAAVLK